MKSKPDSAEQTQRQRFIEAARQLECDEDKERFEKRLGKIVRVKTARDKTPAKP